MATRRFHVGAFQYASEPSASRSSVIPFSAEAWAAGETVCDAQRILEVVDGVLRDRSRSSPSSARLTRSTGPPSSGASSTARENRRSASCGIGRCIPGIVTKPPSGIAPIPYSMPLRVVFAIAGGKPM